jgi:hypothetical protein
MATETPRITETPFDPKGPPATVRLWFCPACGANLTGKSIGLEPARKKCSAKWHLANPVPASYTLATGEGR